MGGALTREPYAQLRDAILAFVAAHPHPEVAPFKEGVANWGDTWSGGTSCYLPAAEFIAPVLATTGTEPETRALAALFDAYKRDLKWEQSYKQSEGLVGSDMLDGYGFVEVIGKNGPFVSTRVRAGIGVWGPNIVYPPHRHQSEEVYVPLAGSAIFEIGDAAPATRRSGDAIRVPSMTTHGFRTTAEPFIVFYVWQAGDLREQSRFG